MSTITVSEQPSVWTRQVPEFIRRCWNALQERRKRDKVRAALYGLSGRDLQDIGIANGEIEYVASNPDIDPRGVRSADEASAISHSWKAGMENTTGGRLPLRVNRVGLALCRSLPVQL